LKARETTAFIAVSRRPARRQCRPMPPAQEDIGFVKSVAKGPLPLRGVRLGWARRARGAPSSPGGSAGRTSARSERPASLLGGVATSAGRAPRASSRAGLWPGSWSGPFATESQPFRKSRSLNSRLPAGGASWGEDPESLVAEAYPNLLRSPAMFRRQVPRQLKNESHCVLA
jgi:hypothetical protein